MLGYVRHSLAVVDMLQLGQSYILLSSLIQQHTAREAASFSLIHQLLKY